MKVSRRDFEAIADVIHAQRSFYWEDIGAFAGLVSDFCAIFAKSNPAFNAHKFRTRCYDGPRGTSCVHGKE